jgi:hypothetical protein
MINEEKVAETLRKVELSLATIQGREDGVVVGRDGSVVLYQRGEEGVVSVDGRLIRDNIFTHIHHNGMCNLSADDVISYIKDDGYEVRVVTPDRRFVSLRRGDGKKNTFLGEDMKRACSGKDFYAKIYRRALEKYESTDEPLMNKELENMMNEWLSSNAFEYGYIFTQGRHEP